MTQARVHLNLNGSWADCSQESCGLRLHLPDMTVEAVLQMPDGMLYELLSILQPPTRTTADGTRLWLHTTRENNMPVEQGHRSYELPAVMIADGALKWYWYGKLHRSHGLPAVVHADGTREWWDHGLRDRIGAPAVVYADGGEEWWNYGRRVK